ncbi:MAG: CarD family transcriptional regulator [Blautia sp.]|nr:CarD family transcriptional regulator [Blautia sp.]
MYAIGDYVVKANNGVCRIENIVHLDLPNASADRMYYLLIPEADKGAKVYVPVDHDAGSIRRVLSAEEAQAVIQKIPEIEEVWISNEKLREQEYKKAIRSMEPDALVSVIKNLYVRRKRRFDQGKKSIALDERFFNQAEDFLYSELAFAMGKEKYEMRQLITDSINQKKS